MPVLGCRFPVFPVFDLTPQIVFPIIKQLPPWADYIQNYTPPIIMTVLVVYSLSSVEWIDPPYGLPEIFCIFLVASLHLWKRNPMLSIFGGTGVYMALIQTGVISRLFNLMRAAVILGILSFEAHIYLKKRFSRYSELLRSFSNRNSQRLKRIKII